MFPRVTISDAKYPSMIHGRNTRAFGSNGFPIGQPCKLDWAPIKSYISLYEVFRHGDPPKCLKNVPERKLTVIVILL